jgi:transposase
MVGVDAALEIRVLHRHGKSIREIARETGVARNTVRRYLRDEAAARYKPRPPRSTQTSTPSTFKSCSQTSSANSSS